jgi:hypothetical protein
MLTKQADYILGEDQSGEDQPTDQESKTDCQNIAYDDVESSSIHLVSIPCKVVRYRDMQLTLGQVIRLTA